MGCVFNQVLRRIGEELLVGLSLILLGARYRIMSKIVVWQVLMHRALNGGTYDYVGNFRVQIKKLFLE